MDSNMIEHRRRNEQRFLVPDQTSHDRPQWTATTPDGSRLPRHQSGMPNDADETRASERHAISSDDDDILMGIEATEHTAISANRAEGLSSTWPGNACNTTSTTPAVNNETLPDLVLGGSSPTSLPADDGMRLLRQQMHQIRDTTLSAEEKAQKMHNLMMAEYERLRRRPLLNAWNLTGERGRIRARIDTVASRETSSRSDRSDSTVETFRPLDPLELEPTYHPHERQSGTSHDLEDSDDESESHPLGCEHYMRNIKVQCPQCERFYTCRHCHDEIEDHILVRKNIRNILCMLCGQPQRATEYCRQCEELTACYYCEVCKLWDNDPAKTIYHCPDCGICRRGEGIGKDYIHCIRCNVCVSIQHAQDHRCVERATDCDCPICGDYLFSSASAVVAMKCGHYIHRNCYDDLMNITYKCPICNRSAVNMELQWRKMDECLESQPMPEQYEDTRAWITCNDCHMRNCVPFHWLGNKCLMCDSYNTNQVSLVNEPKQTEGDVANIEAQQHQVARAAGLPHPSSAALTGNRPRAQSERLVVSDTPERRPTPLGDLALSIDDDNGGETQVQQHRQAPIHRLQRETAFPAPPSPLDADQRSGIAYLRRHAESSASAPASIHSETDDEMGFWGAGLNAGDYMPSMPAMPQMPQMPQMPSMPSLPRMPSVPIPSMPAGWRSPRLFAAAGDEHEAHMNGEYRGWGLDPRQWRLGSPGEFSRPQSPPEGEHLSDDELALNQGKEDQSDSSPAARVAWDPRSWRLLGSPKLFSDRNETDDDVSIVTARSPDSSSGWGIDPRSWRIANQGLFGRSRSVDTAVLQTSSAVVEEPNTSPTSIWNLQAPEFLSRRLGSFSVPGGTDGGDSKSLAKESESSEGSSNSRYNSDGDDEDEADLSGSEKEEGEEDELDLMGHR